MRPHAAAAAVHHGPGDGALAVPAADAMIADAAHGSAIVCRMSPGHWVQYCCCRGLEDRCPCYCCCCRRR